MNNSDIFEDEKNEKCNLEKLKGMCYMDKIYNFFDLTLANNIKCENRDINEIDNFYSMIKMVQSLLLSFNNLKFILLLPCDCTLVSDRINLISGVLIHLFIYI